MVWVVCQISNLESEISNLEISESVSTGSLLTSLRVVSSVKLCHDGNKGSGAFRKIMGPRL